MANKETQILSETEILRILYNHNPWWSKKPIPESKLKEFKRRDYYKLTKLLDDDKITALIGARRVGKTTLLYQLIADLLSKSKPENILFVTLDDIYLHISLDNLEKIFNVYSTNILKKSFDSLQDTIYIILDEIQSLEHWQDALKSLEERGYKIKFIVTGSSSLKILDGTSESLVGRIKHQIVLPMKFLECIRFKEQNELSELVESTNGQLRVALKKSITQNDATKFYQALHIASTILLPYRDRIQVLLQEYLIKGGYPENVTIDDLTIAGENLREYLQLTLYKDIMKMSEVRDPRALENLFLMIAKESSQKFNRTNAAQTLGIKRSTTLNSYIHLLTHAFLISEASFYTKSAAKRARTSTKMYVNDVGIRNVSAAVFDEQVLANSSEMGKIVETVMADHTKRLKFNLESGAFPSIYYWYDGHEVDLIIDIFQKPLPIEIKYREDVSSSDIKGLKKFNEKFNPPLSLVVTKNQLEIHDSTIYVPVWLYLIMC